MRRGRGAAHTFSGSMNSSPHPPSFIHLGPGAGGRKEGGCWAWSVWTVVQCGQGPHPLGCASSEAEPHQATYGLRPGRLKAWPGGSEPACSGGPPSLVLAAGFSQQGMEAGGGCLRWWGLGSGVVWKWAQNALLHTEQSPPSLPRLYHSPVLA